MSQVETFQTESSEACAGVMFGFGFLMVAGVICAKQCEPVKPYIPIHPGKGKVSVQSAQPASLDYLKPFADSLIVENPHF